MYVSLRNKGLGVVSVNSGDSAKTVSQYLKTGGFTFPVVLGGEAAGDGKDVFGKYRVEAFPTNYLVDSRGRVVYASTGFDQAGLKRALAKLGVK